MALAVAEARRVLVPGGCLLDIHPQGVAPRLELWQAAAWDGGRPRAQTAGRGAQQLVGAFRPPAALDDFIATSQTLRAATGAGFKLLADESFDYRYVFESLDDLTQHLEENDELDRADDALLEAALLALQRATQPARLVLAQPVSVSLLRKTATP
jgi:hypothetical protein